MKKITELTEKQQERIIKNCVESIMEDLDDYYFDELFMEWFKKNMHNFLTKKFNEEKIFSFEGK
jgi:predicted DNA-binding protein